ncbi:MAG TPA: hypothetical protein VJB13_02240 [Candidatus Nanoarchaeia archaeon]|nr:hypothetical protein [Candidatus Nanoarchaeia archaeon]
MKKIFPLALAYLNCAPQPEQIPIVEISGRSVTIVEKETKRVARPLKDDPEKAAGFIVTTLEEKLAKYPKAYVVNGDIYFREAYQNSHFQINYTFDSEAFCSLGNNKVPLFKKNLAITVREFKGSFSAKDHERITINLGSQGSPFYPMNTLSATHSGRNLLWVKTHHYTFPEAKKLYNALLLYVAKELQTIERIDNYQNSIGISHPYKTISHEEEKIIQLYHSCIENLKQSPPSSEKINFVQHCNL